MYFNALLAKTLLAFNAEWGVGSGEWGVRSRDAINRVCTGVRSYYFPNAEWPVWPIPNAALHPIFKFRSK